MGRVNSKEGLGCRDAVKWEDLIPDFMDRPHGRFFKGFSGRVLLLGGGRETFLY